MALLGSSAQFRTALRTFATKIIQKQAFRFLNDAFWRNVLSFSDMEVQKA